MNEVANSNAYARTAITFGAAASRRVTQNADTTFPTASGSWGTVTHWAIVDSATHGAGNVLAHGAFAVSKAIVNGNTPTVSSGEVYVELTASTGLTNYTANGFLDRMFRNQAFTVSANYAGLATATLSDSTTSPTEVSGGSYARKEIHENGGSSPAWDLAASGSLDNGAAVTFPTATGSWGTVVAMFIADASTVGNILWYDNGLADQAVASGDTCSWAAGALVLTQS